MREWGVLHHHHCLIISMLCLFPVILKIHHTLTFLVQVSIWEHSFSVPHLVMWLLPLCSLALSSMMWGAGKCVDARS